MDDFSYDELEFEHVDEFAVEYESFLVDDEPKYDVFDFNDAHSVDFIPKVASTYDTFAAPLDLKPFPNSIKYALLGHDESLPVIIASDLNQDQEDKLLNLHRENKVVLGWTLGNIKGISPTIVQHRIHLEGGAKPYRDR